MKPDILNELRFYAKEAAGHEEEYTSDSIVHTIYFGEGDPEQGDQFWGFSRDLGDDDGVCTVKEPQQVTVYGGITDCLLTPESFACEFDEDTARRTYTRRIHITFVINDEIWQRLKQQARLVFPGENYFRLQE